MFREPACLAAVLASLLLGTGCGGGSVSAADTEICELRQRELTAIETLASMEQGPTAPSTVWGDIYPLILARQQLLSIAGPSLPGDLKDEESYLQDAYALAIARNKPDYEPVELPDFQAVFDDRPTEAWGDISEWLSGRCR
jgi:hypothetical protein